MFTYKYIVFYILFSIVMPFKVIIAQETSIDSAIENELADKYDSVISKAAFSLTSAKYKQSLDYYKEASLLKPQEIYPNKMIKYVESIMADMAAKQKLADESKRRVQIRDDLNKANQAIVNRSWDSARVLFNEILTLKPEKTDEEYAKNKISAIDLELKRIALRTAVKQEPVIVVVAPPRNRQEARARRKLAERNVSLASISDTVMPQKQTQVPLPAKDVAASLPEKNVAVTPATKEPPRKPIAAPLPEKNVAVAPATKEPPQKPTAIPLPEKNVAVTPATKEPLQKPIAAPLSEKNVAVTPATKEPPQKPTETLLPQANVGITAPLSEEIPQKAVEGSLSQLTDSSNYIKLICQDISFIGTNAYIKVLIQNYSTTDSFLTDTLQIAIKKNDGNIKKLEQRFISGFPVIMPQKELILVSFADASVSVAPDDVFILEMDDKMKKTKLALQIPWSVYKQQKAF